MPGNGAITWCKYTVIFLDSIGHTEAGARGLIGQAFQIRAGDLNNKQILMRCTYTGRNVNRYGKCLLAFKIDLNSFKLTSADTTPYELNRLRNSDSVNYCELRNEFFYFEVSRVHSKKKVNGSKVTKN